MAHLFYSELTKNKQQNEQKHGWWNIYNYISVQWLDDNRNRSRDFRKHNVNIFKNFT